MAANLPKIVPGIIVSRTGSTEGNPPHDLPDNVKYNVVVAMGEFLGSEFRDMTPTRRISVDAEIVPAEEGDLCWLKFDQTTPYLYVAEGIYFEECSTSSAAPLFGPFPNRFTQPVIAGGGG